MASPADSAPFQTAESILIDGANSVSGASRAGFPQAGVAGLVAVLALVATVALVRRRARWVAGLLALGSLPGLWVVLAGRADAPASRGPLAANIRTSLETLEAQAPWPATEVQVAREDDDVLFPLGRYAWPARPPADGGAVELELRGSKLGPVCAKERPSGPIVCGASP